jgi:hypothetical protein
LRLLAFFLSSHLQESTFIQPGLGTCGTCGTFGGTSRKTEAHLDGNGLFLIVHPSNSKTWQLRYTFQGIRGKIKIGTHPYPDTSLQLARQLANELRQNMAKGIDPKAFQDSLDKVEVPILTPVLDAQS